MNYPRPNAIRRKRRERGIILGVEDREYPDDISALADVEIGRDGGCLSIRNCAKFRGYEGLRGLIEHSADRERRDFSRNLL